MSVAVDVTENTVTVSENNFDVTVTQTFPTDGGGGGSGTVWGGVTGDIADQLDLQEALDDKQPVGSYAASTHSHAISDVTGLQTALDSKANDYFSEGNFQLCCAPNRDIVGSGTQSATNWGFWQTNADDTRRRKLGNYNRVYTSTTINNHAGLRLYEVLTPHIGANNLYNGGYVETLFELVNNPSGNQRFFVGLSANTSTSGTAGNASITGTQGVGLTFDKSLSDTTWFYTHNRNGAAPVRAAFQNAPIAYDAPYLVSFELLASNQVKIRLKNLLTGVTYTETIAVAWALNFYEFYPQIGISNLTSGQLNEFNWVKKFLRRTSASW